MGDGQPVRALDGEFLQEESGHSLVHALPHNLFHQPHDLGKPGGHDLVGVVRQGSGPFHNTPIRLCGDDPEASVLLRLNGDVKLCAPQHTGGGKQTDILVKQAIDCDLTSLVRKDIGPELAGLHQQQPSAVRITVVDHRPLFDFTENQIVQNAALLVR